MPGIALLVHALGQGGTDRVAVLLANGFARFLPTTLVAVAEGGDAADALAAQIEPDVKRVVLKGKAGRRSVDLARTLRAWRRWLSTNRPEVVLATGNNITWFTAWGFAGRRFQFGRLFIKTTNPILRAADPRPVSWLRRTIYSRAFDLAAGILTLSEAERRRLMTQFPRAAHKFKVVANPYVTDAIVEAARKAQARPAQSRKTVIALGRLHRQKNFALLLRAWARAERGDARLIILGDGPEAPMLKALAAELGVAETVTFAGYQADPLPWFAQADLFALSSRYEGLPAVLIEAMAFDLPIVSTDCFEAARELLGDTPGCLLVPPNNENAFASALSDQLRRPHRPSLRHIAQGYTLAASIRSHLTVMELCQD
jgi:glycosyltransferase involved in cell wall biosynthesis